MNATSIMAALALAALAGCATVAPTDDAFGKLEGPDAGLGFADLDAPTLDAPEAFDPAAFQAPAADLATLRDLDPLLATLDQDAEAPPVDLPEGAVTHVFDDSLMHDDGIPEPSEP